MTTFETGEPIILPSAPRRSSKWLFEWAAIALLVVLRLAITWNQPMTALGAANLDDALFIERAATIANGEWMGPYDQFTLMKGPGYPLLIAATYRLGIPLARFQQVLWVGACMVFIAAVSPVMRSSVVRVCATTILLFNPFGFATSGLARVLRQAVYPSITLMLLACAIAVYLRMTSRRSTSPSWLVAGMFLLPLFWLTRDEGVWIVAPLGLLGVLTFVKAFSFGGMTLAGRAIAYLLLPWISLALACRGVSAVNYHMYGIFATIELRSPEFLNAYGALARVKASPAADHLVVVSRAARQKIYAISPAFAELKSTLDGPKGQAWANLSPTVFQLDGTEIGGGWWLWALREAVNLTPHAKSGTEALAFYKRIGDEVNRACDEGRIPARALRATLTPPWHPGYSVKLRNNFRQGWRQLLTYVDIPPTIPASGPPGLDRFETYTLSRLSPQVTEKHAVQDDADAWRVSLLGKIFDCYKFATPWAAALAAISVLVGLFFRRARDSLAVVLVLMVGVNVLLALLSYINFTSFPAFTKGYMAPLPACLLAAIVVALAIPFELWIDRRTSAKNDSVKSPIPNAEGPRLQKGAEQ